MKNIYKLAVQLQDAVNTGAVINEFARMCNQIRLHGGDDTQAFRDHPVTILMVNKLADMVPKAADGLRCDWTAFQNALKECEAKQDLPVCQVCGLIAEQVLLDAHSHEPCGATAIYVNIPPYDGAPARREVVSLPAEAANAL